MQGFVLTLKLGVGRASLSQRPASAPDPLGSTLSGRSWVTLTKKPFSSLAAADLNIQSQRPRASTEGAGWSPPPPHKSCPSPRLPAPLGLRLRGVIPQKATRDRPPPTNGQKAGRLLHQAGGSWPSQGGSLKKVSGAEPSAIYPLGQMPGPCCLWGSRLKSHIPHPHAPTTAFHSLAQ